MDTGLIIAGPQSVLISNCPYLGAMGSIEHALALGYPRWSRSCSSFHFLCTGEQFERLYKPAGHLRRVHVLAERLPGHARRQLPPGKGRPQSQVHAWFVFDQGADLFRVMEDVGRGPHNLAKPGRPPPSALL